MRKVERGQSKTTFEHIAHLGSVEMGQVEGDQSFATSEHIAHIAHLGGVEMRKVEGGQGGATSEHAIHIDDTGGVEMGQVKGGQTVAIPEHFAHVSDTGGVEMFESFDGSEITKMSKPPCSGGGTMVCERGGDDDFLYLLHCPGSSIF